MSTELSADQQANLQYVEELASSDGGLTLDLSDERQFTYAVEMFNLVGQSSDNCPGLHQGLREAQEAHLAGGGPPQQAGPGGGPKAAGWISAVSTLEGEDATAAEAYASVYGGAPVLAAALVVRGADGRVLAKGEEAAYGTGTHLRVLTDPDGALPLDETAYATLLYAYQPQPGEPLAVQTVVKELAKQAVPLETHIEHPVHTKVGWTYIRIGLGREGGVAGDVDYVFAQKLPACGEPTTSELDYEVPFVGYATFEDEIEEIESVDGSLTQGALDPINPSLALAQGQVYTLTSDEKTHILQNCQIAGNKLTWTLQPGPTEAQANPIHFGKLEWATDYTAFFWIQFIVKLRNQATPATVTVQSCESPITGVTTIPLLQFVFHCLAAGTQIRLADGSTATVEELTTDHVLRAPGGEPRPVASTVVGIHEGGGVLKLTVDAERELLLSANHLVVTPAGLRMAAELSAGDEVCVEDGVAELAAVEEVEFDGFLCNASLSQPEERADLERNTMIANGIQVCDFELQTQTQRERCEDPEQILAELDEIYRPDYENKLAKAGQA